MNINSLYTPEEIRESGKACFFSSEGDEEKRRYGIRLILNAYREGDAEAAYIVSRLVLDGVLGVREGDSEEQALTIMNRAANSGCPQARAYLNAYCCERYSEKYLENGEEKNGPLLDFDANPIKINRTGVLTPVDALLEYKDGRNVLTLSTNVMFTYTDDLENAESFEKACVDGILSWAGEYTVFGGQRLSVRVNVTFEDRIFDNLIICPMTGTLGSTARAVANAFGTKKRKEEVNALLDSKRSFASGGIKWTAGSRKMIYIQSRDGRFADIEEIKHVAKHEFGHAIGLGDLYECRGDGLMGVENGTYDDLDCFAIGEKYYNLVMCDHHAPVSNNDIEMVVLAFSENRMQNFQPSKMGKRISSALGKGN